VVRLPDCTRLRHDESAGRHFQCLHFQAASVSLAIGAGSREASQRTLAASIRTLDVADQILSRLGLVFRGEATTAAARH
jgi:hypothetical protein